MDKIEINTVDESFPKYVKIDDKISVEGGCKISNLGMIAKAMSKHDLDELIILWERYHGCEYKEIHP